MDTQTKRRRPPNSGRPRFTTGEIVKTVMGLSRAQHDYLKAQGNMSDYVRRLIDADMAKRIESPE